MTEAQWTRQVRFFEAYREWRDSDEAATLQESGASTDFPNYMKDVLNKRFMKVYQEEGSTWSAWTSDYELPDFKAQSFYGLTELPDLLQIEEGGDYKDSAVKERVGASLSLGTWGRTFSITRKALINDDMGQLRDHPARQARAVRRTMARDIVGKLEGNGNAYDAVALFHATHNNLITDAFSEAGLQAAALKLAQQRDDNNNPIALQPKLIVLPPGLDLVARRVLNSTEIHIQGTGSTPAYGQGNANVMRGYSDYVIDRYLTDANDWYLFADPGDAPVIGVGFLNGVKTPKIMLENPGMVYVNGGGEDPYTMEFDEMRWKVRHDWGSAIIDWRGAVKASVV